MNALPRILARVTFLRRLVLALALPVAAHAAGLNDTGTHPRQDCRYGRDPAATAAGMPKIGAGGKGFDFSKIANDGTVLDTTAVLGTGVKDWACTRDNVTSLIWEIKTSNGLLKYRILVYHGRKNENIVLG